MKKTFISEASYYKLCRKQLMERRSEHNAKSMNDAASTLQSEIDHANALFDALSDLLDLHEDETERPAVAHALNVWNDHKLHRKAGENEMQ